MISINFNPAVLNTQYNLGFCTSSLAKSIQRLTTGHKINSAKDDIAGSYIASKLSTQLCGIEQAKKNTQNVLSLIDTAESSLNNISSSLNRIRDLAVQGSNGTYNVESRTQIQNEAQSHIKHIYQTKDSTEFNNLKLMQEAPFEGGGRSRCTCNTSY